MVRNQEKMVYELKYDDYKVFCTTTLKDLRNKLFCLGIRTEETDFSMAKVKNLLLLLRFLRYLK